MQGGINTAKLCNHQRQSTKDQFQVKNIQETYKIPVLLVCLIKATLVSPPFSIYVYFVL